MKVIEILIVEDDIRIANIHRRFIEKIQGFKVIGIAHTGEEAIEWIAMTQPSLVLLDVYLPDMIATTLLDQVHTLSPETDIIFITAASEAEIVRKAFRSGVTDYILKPITFEKFKESLVSYRKKREALHMEGTLQEDSIQLLWNKADVVNNLNDILPKGIDPITNEKIINHLRTIKNGITAEQIGRQVGVSRSTARRYLEYLVSDGQAYAELKYGTIGRPERRYFPKTSVNKMN